MLQVSYRKPSEDADARAWDWLLRSPQQIRYCDLSAMNIFLRKIFKRLSKTHKIRSQSSLMFEPRFSLSFKQDTDHFLIGVGFYFDDPEPRMYISVNLKPNDRPYIFYERFIAHNSLTHASTEGIWSTEPLN